MRKKQQINIILDIEKLPEGYYLATSNDVPGLVVQAKTLEEVQEIVADAAPHLLQANRKMQKEQESKSQNLGRILYPMSVYA